MQLCECCLDYKTCHLEKRKDEDPLAPCDGFVRIDGLPQDRYEAIKETFRRSISEAQAASKEEIVYNLDVPLEISGQEYPHPEAWLSFINMDLTDEEAYKAFCAKYIDPYFQAPVAAFPDLKEELQKTQAILHAFFDGKADTRGINTYLSWVELQIYRDKEGLKAKTQFSGPLPGALVRHLAPVGLFCVQVAESISRRQEIKQCPVCRDYFTPTSRRGPKPRTCSKGSCRTAMSRNPGRYTRKA